MNPSPSDQQLLTLHQIKSGEVWFASGEWWARGTTSNPKVTARVRRLWQLGYLTFPAELTTNCIPGLTAEGTEALVQYSLKDVLARLNRRPK